MRLRTFDEKGRREVSRPPAYLVFSQPDRSDWAAARSTITRTQVVSVNSTRRVRTYKTGCNRGKRCIILDNQSQGSLTSRRRRSGPLPW